MIAPDVIGKYFLSAVDAQQRVLTGADDVRSGLVTTVTVVLLSGRGTARQRLASRPRGPAAAADPRLARRRRGEQPFAAISTRCAGSRWQRTSCSGGSSSGPARCRTGRPARGRGRCSAAGTRSPWAGRISDGGWPGIGSQPVARPMSMRGSGREQPQGVGHLGLVVDVRAPSRARRPGRRTSRRPRRPRRRRRPRSWVMMMIAVPNSRCRSRSRSRIWACTVTSSAVVGSSAISSSGSLMQSHRDHHALPHAAGQLVRVVVDARSGRSGCRPGRACRWAWLAGLCLGTPRVHAAGLDELLRRSCRTGAATTAGPGRSSPSACRGATGPRSSLAPTSSSPSRRPRRSTLAVLRLCSPMIAWLVTDLPEPGLAHDRERLALGDREGHAVDGVDAGRPRSGT